MRTKCTNATLRANTEKHASKNRPLPQWTEEQFLAAVRRLTLRVHAPR